MSDKPKITGPFRHPTLDVDYYKIECFGGDVGSIRHEVDGTWTGVMAGLEVVIGSQSRAAVVSLLVAYEARIRALPDSWNERHVAIKALHEKAVRGQPIAAR